jgi:hypothetical protein
MENFIQSYTTGQKREKWICCNLTKYVPRFCSVRGTRDFRQNLYGTKCKNDYA